MPPIFDFKSRKKLTWNKLADNFEMRQNFHIRRHRWMCVSDTCERYGTSAEFMPRSRRAKENATCQHDHASLKTLFSITQQIFRLLFFPFVFGRLRHSRCQCRHIRRLHIFRRSKKEKSKKRWNIRTSQRPNIGKCVRNENRFYIFVLFA